MADRVATQDGNWNDNATWGGAAFPTISETVHLLTFHVTANVVASCTWLTGGTSSELILTKNDFTASSTITLDEIAVTTAVDMAGVTLTATLVDIGTNGSLTLSDDLAIDGNLELGGGLLDMNSKDIVVAGNLTYSGGTLDNPGTMTQDDGTLDWGSYTNGLNYELAPGATVSLVDSVFSDVAKFTSPDPSLLQSVQGRSLAFYQPAAGWWAAEGTVAVDVLVNRGQNASGDVAITLADKNLTFQTNGTASITMTADIDIGTGAIVIQGALADKHQTLDMTGQSVTCGAIRLGPAAANSGEGVLVLDGATHSIASIAGGHADNADNTLALGTCTINDMVAGIDGTLIDTVTATAVHLYGNGATTITDVDISAGGFIFCHNFNKAGSTGNVGNVRFVAGGTSSMMRRRRAG